jgi:hypothetical protein
MRTVAALALLAVASLGLTALRYGVATDADAAFQRLLAERLARADIMLVETTATPAFRVLRLRKLGCAAPFRLAFAPDDGGAETALARLLPGAARFTAPGAGALHPGWLVVAEADDATGCAPVAALRAALAGAEG